VAGMYLVESRAGFFSGISHVLDRGGNVAPGGGGLRGRTRPLAGLPICFSLLSPPRHNNPHDRERHTGADLNGHVILEREERLDDAGRGRYNRGRPPGNKEGERESDRGDPGKRPLKRFTVPEGVPPEPEPHERRYAVEHPDRDEAGRGVLPPEDGETEERADGALERHLPGAFRLVENPREDREIVAASEGVADEKPGDKHRAQEYEGPRSSRRRTIPAPMSPMSRWAVWRNVSLIALR